MKKIFTFLIFFFIAESILFGQSPLQQAVEKYRQGNLEGAIIDFETIISNEKEEIKTKEKAKEYLINCLYALGEKTFQAGDNEKALVYLEKAYNLVPENEEVKSLYLLVKEKTVTPVQTKEPVKETPAQMLPSQEKSESKIEGVKREVISLQVTEPVKEVPPILPSQERSELKIEKQVKEKTIPKPVAKNKRLEKTKVTVNRISTPETEKIPQTETLLPRITLIEEKISNLIDNYNQERKELITNLENRDKIIRDSVLFALLIFLVFIFVLQYALRNLFMKNVAGISVLKPITKNPAVKQNSKEVLSKKVVTSWLHNPETKDIAQVIETLLNSPEKEVQEKGFEFLVKITSHQKNLM